MRACAPSPWIFLVLATSILSVTAVDPTTTTTTTTTSTTTTTTTTTTTLPDYPKPDPPPCFYLADALREGNNLSLAIANVIARRCRDVSFKQTVQAGSKKVLDINNKRCGVRNMTTVNITVEAAVNITEEAEICYAPQPDSPITGDVIQLSIEHSVRLSNVKWHDDFGDLRRSRFWGRKRRLELDWTDIMLNNSMPGGVFEGWEFDRVEVVKFMKKTPPVTKRRRRQADGLPLDDDFDLADGLNDDEAAVASASSESRAKRAATIVHPPEELGILATAVVKFATKNATLNHTLPSYQALWTSLAIEDIGKFAIDSTEEIIKDVNTCGSPAKLSLAVPSEIWAATAKGWKDVNGTDIIPGVNFTLELSEGQVVNFICPQSSPKLSFDTDGYEANDDKFTVACTALNDFQYIEDRSDWPKCVSSCPMRLPVIPDPNTGLEPVIPDNTIAAGQFGHYVCTDRSQGVNKGASEFLPVKCLSSGDYDLAPDGEWPTCAEKTTTIKKPILIALETQMTRRTKELEDKHRLYQWQEGDEHYVKPVTKSHITDTTMPWVLGMLLIIIIVCLCSHKNSPLCRICEDGSRRKKYMRPYRPDRPPASAPPKIVFR